MTALAAVALLVTLDAPIWAWVLAAVLIVLVRMSVLLLHLIGISTSTEWYLAGIAQAVGDREPSDIVEARAVRDVPYLIRALTDTELRALAIRFLVELRAAEAVPALIRLLDAADPAARRAAARALGELEAIEASDRLLDLVRHDQDPPARGHAIAALAELAATGELADRDFVPMFVSHLHDPQWQVRVSAAFALSRLPDARAEQPLREARRRERGLKNRYLTGHAYKKALKAIRKAKARPSG